MREKEIIEDAKAFVNNIKNILNDGNNDMSEENNTNFYTLQLVIQRFIRFI